MYAIYTIWLPFVRPKIVHSGNATDWRNLTGQGYCREQLKAERNFCINQKANLLAAITHNYTRSRAADCNSGTILERGALDEKLIRVCRRDLGGWLGPQRARRLRHVQNISSPTSFYSLPISSFCARARTRPKHYAVSSKVALLPLAADHRAPVSPTKFHPRSCGITDAYAESNALTCRRLYKAVTEVIMSDCVQPPARLILAS